MSLCRFPSILGIACVLLVLASAQNPVHIRRSEVSQLLTSSTLTWISHTQYYDAKQIPRDIVIGGYETVIQTVQIADNETKSIVKKNPIFVCRAQHEGTWVAGSQKQGEKKCTVGFLGNRRSYDRYDLLENVDSAGKLSWTSWDKFNLPPNGMVAVHQDKLYIARHSLVTQGENADTKYNDYCIGTFTLEEGFGKVVCAQNGIQKSYDDGELLVETEATKYDLKNIKLNNKTRVMKAIPQILGQATIQNTGPNTAKMAEAFAYSFNYSIYWGQVRAMSKGLDTSITLQNGTSLGNVKWGTEDRGNRTIVHTVDIVLQPGTAVNVTLKGNLTEVEVYYTGDLISHYADSSKARRMISGFRREEGMMDVHAEFSPIYFLSNLSAVPTTEPPPPTTTTEPTTTTTTTVVPTTTTKRAPQPPILMSGTNEKTSLDGEVDENSIVSPKKTDVNMQNGDAGPFSLRNRSDADRSSAWSHVPMLTFIVALILSINRIT